MKINFIIILLSGYFNYIFTKNPEYLSISVYENTYKKETYNENEEQPEGEGKKKKKKKKK